MTVFKKLGNWILFLLVSIFGIYLVQAIITFVPFLFGLWLFRFSDFWFYFIGSISITIYYYLGFGVLIYLFLFIEKLKQDYWVSNIIMTILTLSYYYFFITFFGSFIDAYIDAFFSFKGILLLITIVPVYFYVMFISLIAPFTRNTDA